MGGLYLVALMDWIFSIFRGLDVWLFILIVLASLELYISKFISLSWHKKLEGQGVALNIVGSFISIVLAFIFYFWQGVRAFM